MNLNRRDRRAARTHDKSLNQNKSNKDIKRLKPHKVIEHCFFCSGLIGGMFIPAKQLNPYVVICPKCMISEQRFLTEYACLKNGHKFPNGALELTPTAEFHEILIEYKKALDEFNAPEEK